MCRVWSLFVAIAWVIAFISCGGSSGKAGGGRGQDLAGRAGLSELAVGPPQAPDGSVDFYLGEAVLEAYLDGGTFAPREDVVYSRIRLPDGAVEQALRDGGPVTLSLCDADNGVELFHQTVADFYEPMSPSSINCTPWVQYHEGRMTIEYTSGQPGVFGYVQVGLRENGNLFAGAVMNGSPQSPCEDGGVGTASMFLGTIVDDPSPEDPMVDDCQPLDGP